MIRLLDTFTGEPRHTVSLPWRAKVSPGCVTAAHGLFFCAGAQDREIGGEPKKHGLHAVTPDGRLLSSSRWERRGYDHDWLACAAPSHDGATLLVGGPTAKLTEWSL